MNAGRRATKRPLPGLCLGLVFVGATLANTAHAQGVARFDGNWTVVVNCANAPDGARGYRLVFPATIKAGRIAGSYNPGQNVSTARLSGTIRGDGAAALAVSGRTGDPRFNTGGVAGGQAYAYKASGTFDGNSGSARRASGRECSLSFSRS